MWLSWVYLVLFFQRPIASSSYLKEERQKITLVREKRVCVADLCVCSSRVAPHFLFWKNTKLFCFWFCFFELSKRFSEIDWKVFKTERQVHHVIWALQMESKHWHWRPPHSCWIDSTLFCVIFTRNRLAKKKVKEKGVVFILAKT